MTIDVITFDALSTKHGFFCRAGGISTGIYAGLNCGFGSDDAHKNVLHNRTLVAQYLGVTPQTLGGVHQIHSPTVHIVTPKTVTQRPKADALVTNYTGLALGVLAADCAPILFDDADAGVIGAAHSGWKGAVGGVIQSTITEMIKLGAARENITAAVGPCISQASYEVGPEFLDQFVTENTDFSRCFTNGTDDRYLFDLPSFCLHLLRAEDIAHAEWVGHCTYTNESRFYSYRRTTHRKESDYGRMISAIVL